jgi:hypothetical protein
MRRRRRRLSPDTVRAWSLTLVGGLVVALVVAFLLERLRRAVADVEDRVEKLWTSGKHLAQNTQAAHLVSTTVTRTRELADELQPHRRTVEGGTE